MPGAPEWGVASRSAGAPPSGAASGLQVRLLGPVEVVRDGCPVRLPGPKPVTLLVLLAIHVGETVPAGRLIESLWAGRPPPSADAVLRTYVAQLRRALGAGVIGTSADGYALRLDPACVDARLFEQQLAQARSWPSPRRAEVTAAQLRRALALWRGTAFGELAPGGLRRRRDPAAGGTAPGRARRPARRGPGGRPPRHGHRRAPPARHRAAAAGPTPRPAHRRAVPVRPPRRSTRRLPGLPAAAHGRAGRRAVTRPQAAAAGRAGARPVARPARRTGAGRAAARPARGPPGQPPHRDLQLRRPGRGDQRGHRPGGPPPAGDADRGGRLRQDPARAGGRRPAGRAARGRGVAGRAGRADPARARAADRGGGVGTAGPGHRPAG